MVACYVKIVSYVCIIKSSCMCKEVNCTEPSPSGGFPAYTTATKQAPVVDEVSLGEMSVDELARSQDIAFLSVS